MNLNKAPFNIDLLIPKNEDTKYVKFVTSLDIFQTNTKNFHPDGLYSTEIFGVVGTPAREARFSYIDIKIPILHPLIFNTLITLKSLYKNIIIGKTFAVFDENIKDFVKSDNNNGETGYAFFLEHFKKIEFEQRDSISREQNIRLIEKYKNNCLTDKIIVIPAGFRDIEIDNHNRPSSDEINDFYYKELAISNTILKKTAEFSPEIYNTQRVSMQNYFNQIYDYLNAIIEGKKNLMMGKWASRKIFNGTRNVITSSNIIIDDLDEPDITINDTMMGLYQFTKSILPVTIYQLKNKFLSECFFDQGIDSLLTNKKTLQSERVNISTSSFEKWFTNEGLEKLISYFGENSIRHKAIEIDGYYLGLCYKKDGVFKFIHGVDELPSGYDEKDCNPITYMELLYHAVFDIYHKYPIVLSRYPISGIGSIYPSTVYLKTTIESENRVELDDNWSPTDKIAKEFPIYNSSFFNSMSPNFSKLSRLGADKKTYN